MRDGNVSFYLTFNGNQTEVKSITGSQSEVLSLSTYDTQNRLESVTKDGVTSFYDYNVDGLRKSKTVNGQTTKHIWDGSNIVLEQDGNNNDIGKYIRGINLIYSDRGNGNQQYHLFNGHGDVLHLTGLNGSLNKSYSYDAFGNEKNLDENDTNPFRYCGEYYDKETDNIYLRARYYNPSIGRFISEDSYLGDINDPLTLNLYTYCQNNPVIYVDPSGYNPEAIRQGIDLGKLLLDFLFTLVVVDQTVKTMEEVFVDDGIETFPLPEQEEPNIYVNPIPNDNGYHKMPGTSIYNVNADDKLPGTSIVDIGTQDIVIGGGTYVIRDPEGNIVYTYSANGGNKLDDMTPNELSKLTREQLKNRLPDGWTYAGSPDGKYVHIKDANDNYRLRLDPPDKATNYPHTHIYDANGNALDISGNIVSPESRDAHISR